MASAAIEAEGKELAPKLSVRALAKLVNASVTTVQKALVDLREGGLMDDQNRLTPKGMEAALELGKDQTGFDDEEQSEAEC